MSAGSSGLGVSSSLSDVQDSQCPVSNSVLMSVWMAAQGMTLPWAAVLYSGWKLNGVPAQLAIEVFWKPLAAEACMEPLVCRVRSSMTTSKALPPPGAGASNMWILIVSPGLKSSVSLFGVNGGGVRVLRCRRPGRHSVLLDEAEVDRFLAAGLHVTKPVVHSRLSMVSAAHHCVSLQLSLSTNGGFPGG